MQDDTVQKALNRLLSAVLGLEPVPDGQSRVDVIEEALAYAMIASGQKYSSTSVEDIRDNLDALAVQLILDKMERTDRRLLHIEVAADEEDEDPVLTVLGFRDDGYAQACVSTIDRMLDEEEVTMTQRSKDFNVN